MKRSYHVVRLPNGNWCAKKPNAKRRSSIHRTQREAELWAKERLRRSGGGEVRIHGLDGNIRDSDTVEPGRDPFPPKDRKH
jgi:hypothetical protein